MASFIVNSMFWVCIIKAVRPAGDFGDTKFSCIVVAGVIYYILTVITIKLIMYV